MTLLAHICILAKMTIKRFYNRAIRRQLGFFAAWPPVSNDIVVGSFGLMRGGIFTRIGHVNDFGVTFDTVTSPPSSYNFKSEGVTKVRTQAGVKVPVFEVADVDAQLDILFEGDRTLNLDIKKMHSEEMASAYKVAQALAQKPGWKARFRVVDKVYIAEFPAIFVSQTKGTTVSIKGKAKILKQVDEGLVDINADISVKVEQTNAWTMPSEGTRSGVGPVHIHLFRVKGGSAAPILGELAPEDDIIDGSEDWPTTDDDSDMPDLPAEQD